MKKSSGLIVTALLMIVSGIFFAACSSGAVMEDEFEDRFNKSYDKRALEDKEKQAEWFKEQYLALEQMRRDEFNRQDGISGKGAVPQLKTVDAQSLMLDRARPVVGEVNFIAPLAEAVKIYAEEIRRMAASQGKESPIKEGEEVKPEDVLPPYAIISPDGMARIKLYSTPQTTGFLGANHILTVATNYSIICKGTEMLPADVGGRAYATFTILPNGIEGEWKRESVLTDRNVREMCNSPQDGDPKHYPKPNFVVFQRPAIKVFPVPKDEALEVASLDAIWSGNAFLPIGVLFPAVIDNRYLLSYGLILDIKREGNGPPLIMFYGVPGIFPSQDDEGAMLYYIDPSATEPLRPLAFIVDTSDILAIAIPAEFVLQDIEEFPFAIPKS